MQIVTPVPDHHLDAATRLWNRHFAPPLGFGTPRLRACHAIAAIGANGQLLGVAGFRDQDGGVLDHVPWLARQMFRPAPPTADLVIDGIAVAIPRRGIGRALVDRAGHMARGAGRPGLRAEVEAGNVPAMDFHAAMRFAEIGRGRFGWPWSGPVAILHRPS